jgi:hypothetical protein
MSLGRGCQALGRGCQALGTGCQYLGMGCLSSPWAVDKFCIYLQRQASGKSNIFCSMSLKQHVFNKIGVSSFAALLILNKTLVYFAVQKSIV